LSPSSQEEEGRRPAWLQNVIELNSWQTGSKAAFGIFVFLYFTKESDLQTRKYSANQRSWWLLEVSSGLHSWPSIDTDSKSTDSTTKALEILENNCSALNMY
jgi:hypothetical protein